MTARPSTPCARSLCSRQLTYWGCLSPNTAAIVLRYWAGMGRRHHCPIHPLHRPLRRLIPENPEHKKTMLKTIEADFPSTMEPGFTTPPEAIRFSKSVDSARDSEEISSCIGRIVNAVEWRGDYFRLHLDNGKVLHVGCARNGVDLTIDDDLSSNVPRGPQIPDVVLVRL